jgi:hypothetical protein
LRRTRPGRTRPDPVRRAPRPGAPTSAPRSGPVALQHPIQPGDPGRAA